MNRKKVGIIVTDLAGGDALYQIVSEEDYNTVCAFEPKKIWMEGTDQEKTVFDSDEYQYMVGEHFYDELKDEEKNVIKSFYTQTYVPEKIDLSEYDIIGMLTLPGG